MGGVPMKDLVVAIAAGIVAVALIVGAVVLILGTDRRPEYRVVCHEAGGHIYAPSDVWFCLNDDGRMLEVYVDE
jgi:hypothetical protein